MIKKLEDVEIITHSYEHEFRALEIEVMSRTYSETYVIGVGMVLEYMKLNRWIISYSMKEDRVSYALPKYMIGIDGVKKQMIVKQSSIEKFFTYVNIFDKHRYINILLYANMGLSGT